MEIRKFNMMLNDRHFCDLKKLLYKYPEDMKEFIDTLKEMYLTELPVSDFEGKAVSFIECKTNVNMNSFRLLLINQSKASVIHFLIAYYHPYFDGNGRMARLIHLWFLVQRGFGNTLFIPFSSYIVRSLKKYYEAYTLVENNRKITGVLDVTPFIEYFSENVYNRFEMHEFSEDLNELFLRQVRSGSITEKEEKLWKFVAANYGTDEFSTKQLEKDFGNAAYATIRSFVLKFEETGLLSSRHFSNRVKYKINENH